MKNIKLWFVLLCGLSILSCRKEIDSLIIDKEEAPPTVLIESALRGKVVDEGGVPLANVALQIENEIAFTDANGVFHIVKAEVKKSGSLIKATATGFFTASSNINFTADGGSYVQLTMLEKETPELIQSSVGGSFTNSQGVKVTIPANSIVDQNNNAYNGTVNVYTRHLNPLDENLGAIMPGDLNASGENGEALALETYGMVMIELESESGMPLEINDNAKFDLEIPIPAELLDDAPGVIPLWFFNLEEEEWLLTGSCDKVGNSYHCSVPYTGSWNCDVDLPAICLSGQIYNSDSTFAAYVQVIVEDLSNNFIYWGYTDSLGYFCGSVPQGAPLQITIKDLCDNTVYTESIGPYANDFELADIYLDDVINQFMIKVMGSIMHCLSNDVANGHLAVRYPGNISIYPITAGGFAADLTFNCVDFPDLEISAYSNRQRNSTIVNNFNDFADIDLGLQPTCEELPDSFGLTINNLNYWTAPTQWYFEDNSSTNWLVLEGLSAAGKFTLDLKDYSGTGQYTSNVFIRVENEVPFPDLPFINTSSPNVTVDITVDDGEYIEGTIVGNYTDGGGVPITLDGQFRIRKAP